MIKRANSKKKKGFTLIELIIVLAVMAIIALIAIPNFAAVRNNSKNKADDQSRATIERTVLMLVSDETVKGDGTVTLKFDANGKLDKTNTTIADSIKDSKDIITEALKEVKAPQGKVKGTETKATTYEITISTDGSVEVVTGAVKAEE